MAGKLPRRKIESVPCMYACVNHTDNYGWFKIDILVSEEQAKELSSKAKIITDTEGKNVGPFVRVDKDKNMVKTDDGLYHITLKTKNRAPEVTYQGKPYTGEIGNESIVDVEFSIKSYELSEDFKKDKGIDYDVVISKYLNKVDIKQLVEAPKREDSLYEKNKVTSVPTASKYENSVKDSPKTSDFI